MADQRLRPLASPDHKEGGWGKTDSEGTAGSERTDREKLGRERTRYEGTGRVLFCKGWTVPGEQLQAA